MASNFKCFLPTTIHTFRGRITNSFSGKVINFQTNTRTIPQTISQTTSQTTSQTAPNKQVTSTVEIDDDNYSNKPKKISNLSENTLSNCPKSS